MCLVSVNKDDDNSPAPRPVQNGDTYVRRRTSARNSARASQLIAIQHGSHQSVHIPLRPSQTVVRVSSTRVQQTSSPVPIPTAAQRASYALGTDRYDGHALHQSISPPLVGRSTQNTQPLTYEAHSFSVQAPTPPQASSPRISRTVVYHDPSPRTTQQSFTQISRHSSHSRHSHHSRNGSHHSRSGSTSGRHSRAIIVDPPTVETHVSRSRSDAGPRGYSPGPSKTTRYGRGSTPSIQPVISRERSKERTSTGVSYLDPEIGRIQQGLKQNQDLRIKDGEVKGLLGGGDGGEAVRIVYGRGPRVSAGRLGTHGERNLVYEDGGRRHYGSQ